MTSVTPLLKTTIKPGLAPGRGPLFAAQYPGDTGRDKNILSPPPESEIFAMKVRKVCVCVYRVPKYIYTL